MQCPNCHFNNASGAKFCKSCGHALAAASAQPPSYPPAMPPYQQSASPVYPPAAPAPQPAFPQAPPQSFAPPPSPAAPVPPQGPGMVNSWASPAAQPYAPTTSVRQVRRISPKSAFKVAAGIYGLIYGVLGLLGFLFSVIGILFAGDLLYYLDLPVGSGIAGILLSFLLFILTTALIALVAGVSAAIAAWIYNLVAGRIGGLEVDVI